jgi:hypothetical protein
LSDLLADTGHWQIDVEGGGSKSWVFLLVLISLITSYPARAWNHDQNHGWSMQILSYPFSKSLDFCSSDSLPRKLTELAVLDCSNPARPRYEDVVLPEILVPSARCVCHRRSVMVIILSVKQPLGPNPLARCRA